MRGTGRRAFALRQPMLRWPAVEFEVGPLKACGWATGGGYAFRWATTLPRRSPPTGRRLAGSFDWVSLACLSMTRRRISPTWPARFFSTCSLQTKRHGQSLFGHFSRRANCLRRSRTNALSLINCASSCVSTRCLPFIMMKLKAYSSPSGGLCHLYQWINLNSLNTIPT
jgi:hypothetical protein